MRTCAVCRTNKSVLGHSLELRTSSDRLIADVETYLCQDCSERVADELLNVVMKVRADHLSEVS